MRGEVAVCAAVPWCMSQGEDAGRGICSGWDWKMGAELKMTDNLGWNRHAATIY